MTFYFKKSAKQIIAAILCICMMAGIMPLGVPVVNASAEEEGNVEFPFLGLTGVSNKSLISTVTYANTKNTWQFKGQSAGVDSTLPGVNARQHDHYYTSTYGTTIAGLAKDEWVAYELSNIKADEYDVSFDHLVSTTGCEAELYILPASDSWSISDCSSSNYVGIVKCYDAAESFVKGTNIGKFTAGTDGNYIMVLKGNGVTYGDNSEYYKSMWLHKMQLISSKPNLDASVGLDYLMVGTKTTLSISLTVGLTDIDITYDDIEVSFGTPGVARFNAADGSIEAIGPGTTTVTVSTEYNDQSTSETLNITVVEDLVQSGPIKYDFMLSGVAHQTNMKGLSGSNWSFLDEHKNATLAHRVYHHWFSKYYGLEYSGGAAGEHVAYRFDGIAEGEYDFTASHLTYVTGGIAEIYMLPYSADWSLDDCDESTYVGTIDCYSTVEEKVTSPVGTFKAPKDGSYVMVIKNTGRDPSGNGYRLLWISDMTLVPDIPMLSASLSSSGVVVGSSVDLSIGLTVGAYDVIDIGYDDIEVTFGTPGVASFDPQTGKITGNAAGKTTVTVSTVYEGETASKELNLSVAEYGAEYLEFNFAEHAKYPIKSHPESLNVYSYGDGFLRYLPTSNDYVWTEIDVPDAGAYTATIENILYTGGTIIEVHMVPASVKDLHEAVVSDAYLLGEVDTYAEIEDRKGKTKIGTVVVEEPGKYNFVVQGTGRHSGVNDYVYTNKFILDGIVSELKFDSSTIEISQDPAKNSTQAHIVSNLLDKWENAGANVMTFFRSSDPNVATVDENGIVTAVKVGTAKISGTYASGGRSFSVYRDITVADNSEPLSATISVPETIFVNGKYKLDVDIAMASGGVMKALEHGGEVEFDVSITPEGAATFDPQTRIIEGVFPGSVTINATASFRGKSFDDIPPVTVEVKKTSKDKSTIYTDEIREAMRYNAEHDQAIRAKANGYINKANKHIERVDDIYKSIVGEGIFRYYFVGHTNDPNKLNCRYCGAYIPDYTHLYGWVTDPVNMPWKIQCPKCRRRFPSNDFGKYYELGLDAKGNFDHERAKAAHIELFGGLENVGYLKNTEYPEMDEHMKEGELVNPGVHGWGVDDGWGYTTKNPKTGLEEHHYYIAFYLHQAIWDGNDGSLKDAVPTVLEDLKKAYLYTNDAKYARAGIKILDRIADFYPDYEWYPWHDMRGDTYRGKIVDSTWSNAHARKFVEAYDAFFPVYEDASVISYLSKKAIEQETADENPKNSAAALRNHVEDNILREIMKSAKNQNLSGNFGMTQNAVAKAAVALNSMPETGEWLDWVNAPGASFGVDENPPECTGGNLLPQIMLTVDRDGMGNEGSPSYNNGWVTLLIELADVLAGYELYPQADLYKNPKFIKMLSAQFPLVLAEYYTPAIGDSGSYASPATTLNANTLATAYHHTKDPIFAQALYLRNKNSAKGLVYPETVLNPSKLEDEVEEVIAKYGELDLRSTVMSGYGFSVIRDGDKYPDINTHRDFWMYYGKNRGHAHRDSLNLGIDAFGLNLTPDLGYPSATGQDPERLQWVEATISHNTVTVNEKTQNNTNSYGFPIHFDDSGKVKLMEAERPISYSAVDEYRRTVVMIDVDDTVAYGVDFFRVSGGNDHLYSFHAQSESYSETEGLNLVAAGDPKNTYGGIKKGNYFKRGPDPHPQSGIASSADGLTYPAGYTWMDNVESDYDPKKVFAVDLNIGDVRNAVKDNKDIHLRMTMVNDFELDEVSVVNGYPVITNSLDNCIKYVLARRKGSNLKTLFTTVLEPYKGERYLSGMENVQIVRADGKDIAEREVAKAIKVIHKNGRIDYVAYSQDNSVEYKIIDGDLTIPFKGFVGVVTYEDADKDSVIGADDIPVYTYLHDGEKIAKNDETLAAYTGMVVSYTDELSLENYIEVDIDQADVNLEELAGKVINVNNDKTLNGIYRILGAEKLDNGNIKLDIGEVSVIRGYVDNSDLSKGFDYNIKPSQTFRIPLSYTGDSAPVLSELSGTYKATAGKRLTFTVNATSEAGKELTVQATSLPRGASFDSASKTFAWTPTDTQLGEHSATIKVSDGTLSTTYIAEITVHRSSGSVNDDSTPSTPSTPETPSGDSGTGSTPPAGDNAGSGSGSGSGGGASGGGGASSGGDSGNTETGGDNTGDVGDGVLDVPSEKFVDLGNHAWAEEAIYALVEKGVVNGTSAKTYSPANNIKRADFAIMLVRAFDIAAGEGENFADVDASKYYAEELRLAKANGIVGGIGDNKFNPEGEITRQDMMVMLARALKAAGKELDAADESVLAEFADAAAISDYAREAVAQLVGAGAIAGANGKINPLGRATRAEVAMMLNRIFA